MKIYSFKGTQEIENKKIDISGYFKILPKENEFSVPISGKLIIKEMNEVYDLKGDLKRLSPSFDHSIDFFAKRENLEFFYRFNPKFFNVDKVDYEGFYVSCDKIDLQKLLVIHSGTEVDGCEKVSIELEVDKNFKEILP